jgi:ABC-type lipoprotein release transport system permease subunit
VKAGPRRTRVLLAALGVLAASLVVGTAATVGYGLATGFDRAAEQADLPHVIARFDREDRATVDARVRALPNLAARSYRFEARDVPLRAAGHATRKGLVHFVLGGRRGYAIVEGRDLRGQGEAVIERGLARDWGVRLGDRITLGRGVRLRVVGVAVEPDNVAFPLTVTPRVYTLPWERGMPANLAMLWLNDPERADVTLTQARATSFGVGNLQFVTRAGIRVLLGQAAGIVISLLVAFSLVALVAAGTMLAAGASAEVARRLPAFGVQRALGFTPARLAAAQAREAALVALPAAVLGLAAGALAVAGPSADLLAQLNEQPPGWALLPVLGACLLAIVGLFTAAATWPAWRAARRPPAEILRPGRVTTKTSDVFVAGGGLLGIGARFATAARGRYAAAVATIAVCAGVVTLMLALASLLQRLRDDPGSVGKRYQLTTRLEPFMVPSVAAIPGVEAAEVRYQVDVADSFRLGQPLRMIAYPGDHTEFEAPPLAAGRRLRSAGEAEVGQGLADALGLEPGATLAVQLQGAGEVRFRAVGVVRALERDGRVAYVRPDRLLAADRDLGGASIAVRLAAGADRAAVERKLTGFGAPPLQASAATTRNAAFLGVLATVLRGVGLAVGLVCLYALAQALAVTARERRGAVALLRAVGGDDRTVATVLAGAALTVALPAAVAGVLLEWLVFGPLVARLAAGFAVLPLAPTVGQVAIVLGGLLLLAAAATAVVARRTMREPVVAGLREE